MYANIGIHGNGFLSSAHLIRFRSLCWFFSLTLFHEHFLFPQLTRIFAKKRAVLFPVCSFNRFIYLFDLSFSASSTSFLSNIFPQFLWLQFFVVDFSHFLYISQKKHDDPLCYLCNAILIHIAMLLCTIPAASDAYSLFDNFFVSHAIVANVKGTPSQKKQRFKQLVLNAFCLAYFST